MEVDMFGRFSNTIDALMAVQQSVEAARRNDYFERSTTCRGSYPYVDLFQKNDDTILTVELPGVKKEDINVEIKDNLFRISGERKVNYPEKSSVHRVERQNLNFDRTVKLPARVDGDKVTAEYTNGVLKVTMPRAESDKPKQIKVA
jgi:HSP20 family protein